MRLTSFVSVLLLAIYGFAQPNQFRFHTYGQDEGLNSPSVNVMAEDTFGFIWIGSEDGLYRFDAYDFVSFRKTQNVHQELPSNSITALHPLPDGSLIVGTREGLTFFDAKTQKFTNLWTDQEPVYICKIVPYRNEQYWIATRNGLHQFDFKSRTIQATYLHDPNDEASISSNGLVDAFIDSKGKLWISTYNGGLNLFQSETDDFKRYQHDPKDPQSISSNALRKLAEAPDGRILVGTADKGLNVLNTESGQFQHFIYQESNPTSLSAISVYSLLVDSRAQLWVGTWSNGLNLFDLETGKSERYVYDADDLYSVPHNSIKCLMESSSGDIWIGTDDAGIARLSLSEEKIVRFRSNSKSDNSLKTDYVRSVYEDNDGMLWIGTAQNGLHKYDPTTNQFEFFLLPDDSRRAKSRGNIWSISAGADEILWIGTGIGLGKFDKKTGKTIFYEPDDNNEKSISTNTALKVHDDGKGSVWVGTWEGGLNRLDINAGEFEVFINDPNSPSSIGSNTITAIFTDAQGNLWHNAGGQLHVLNADKKSFTRFDIHVNAIAQDEAGDFWLTSDEGLLKFNPIERVAERIEMKMPDGLESTLMAVEIDDQGIIWLGSEQGIICYDPATKNVAGRLFKGNGLVGNNISNGVSEFGQQSKKLYFGGIQGLSMIDPKMLTEEIHRPRIVITDFLLSNESVAISDSTQLSQSISTSPKVSLNYNDYIFAFEFAALSFSHSTKIKYAYQLQGFDQGWIYTDHLDRKAVYTNVPPGDYTFMVKCTDQQGNWIEDQIVSVEMEIVPPWWDTWWAKTAFYLAILLLIFAVVSARMAMVRKQKQLLEQQVLERSAEILKQKEELEVQAMELTKVNNQKNKLFSIIAHDLKTPVNTLSSLVPLLSPEILNAENLTMIKENLSDRVTMISTAMEDLLAWAKSQMEGEIITKTNVSLESLAAEMYNLFEPYAESKGIKLTNQIKGDLHIIADENQMQAVLRNLLSNALKFTPKGGEVVYDAKVTGSKVIISIADTGVGIPEDKLEDLFEIKAGGTKGTKGEQGVGLGLIVVKEFVDKNDGVISVKTTQGKGTTFFVEFDLASKS